MTAQISRTIAWAIFCALLDVSVCGEAVYLTADVLPYTARELTEVTLTSGMPRSHAGYITVSENPKNHLFFWYFPAENDRVYNLNRPLLVWLNGGPTLSSMLTLLWDNGPVRIRKSANGDLHYEHRPGAWTAEYAMLYIDNPVGTGFSYTEDEDNGYNFTQEKYTNDLFTFLKLFTRFFPMYLQRQIYIGGVSYAGKYVPALAHKIHTEFVAGRSSINLTGIYLGGPLFDPQTQIPDTSRLLYSVGYMSHHDMIDHKTRMANMMEQYNSGELNTTSLRHILKQIFKVGAIDNFHTRSDYRGIDTIDFLQSDIMREALHVGNRTFLDVNPKVQDKFGEDFFVSTKDKLAFLMDNYKVLLYNGNYDGIVNTPMMEKAIMSTPWSGQNSYNQSSRSEWHIRGTLSGFYNYVGKFCRVVILKGGHSTVNDQFISTRKMIKQFIEDGCVQCTLTWPHHHQ